MSLEQAILELAAAMKEQAAAQRESNEVQRATAAGYEKAVTAYAIGGQRKRSSEDEAGKQAHNDELAQQSKTEEVKPDAELETAVQQVEQAAQEEAAPLDYKADVRPVLLALNKAKGADALKGLLGKYGAATGDKLDAEHYAAIVADAKALIG